MDQVATAALLHFLCMDASNNLTMCYCSFIDHHLDRRSTTTPVRSSSSNSMGYPTGNWISEYGDRLDRTRVDKSLQSSWIKRSRWVCGADVNIDMGGFM
jgi:hypothetical protein